MKLPDADFRKLIENAPLIAMDLIVRDEHGKVLLGLRNAPPAKDVWFVPGGRIYKNETLQTAFERISYTEVGCTIDRSQVKILGLFEHIYPDNVFLDSGFNTHYIIIALEIRGLQNETLNLKNQHSHSKFETVENLLAAADVHQFTKNYFIPSPPNRFEARFGF